MLTDILFWSAVLTVSFVVGMITIMRLMMRRIRKPPVTVRLKCRNCGGWVRLTMNGPVHNKVGGSYCDQPVAVISNPPRPRVVIRGKVIR